ncbi:MAG TPA: ATP-binding protein [Alphaproteobacteria bacterium]|nr:ATP-binding protein [Alphaproteobacteria bacterium]
MIYGINERRGFVAVTGEVGTGKTTLIYTLLNNLNRRYIHRVFSCPLIDKFLCNGAALCRSGILRQILHCTESHFGIGLETTMPPIIVIDIVDLFGKAHCTWRNSITICCQNFPM